VSTPKSTKPRGGRSAAPRGRQTRQTVRTARGRKLSSTRWLDRQLNDPYVAAAERDGWRSRAAYKLIQIDEKTRILKPGQRVVDLGAAPGGWSQVAAKRVGEKGAVIALDRLEFAPIPGVDILIRDFTDNDVPDLLRRTMGGPADIVLSDMSPNTTGHASTDHLRIVALVEMAAHFAFDVLSPGGAFVAKVFQGGTDGQVLQDLKTRFQTVKHIKPEASRAESAEIYVVATGFRGTKEA